ncbi:TPA: phage tail assembly protein T [Serratia marcescens]
MRLAHEFRRADWRRMLSEMTASEFACWVRFFGVTPFSNRLLDAEFAALNSTIVSLVSGDVGMSARDFSLLAAEQAPEEMTEELLMSAGEGLAGGIRYGAADS